MARTGETRAHGGDLDRAVAQYGGARAEWLDLSTGINPHPWPVQAALKAMPETIWHDLPDRHLHRQLLDTARQTYGLHPDNAIVVANGTQALIQVMPRIAQGRQVTVRHPSYNEHRGVFADAGWQVVAVAPEKTGPAETAIIVNPNNPDGHRTQSDDLLALAGRVGTLVVDEAFMDMTAAESLCRHDLPANVVVLRSFGKFFGLAGLRLGFAVGAPETIAGIAGMLGPWAVAGPALHLGTRALADNVWIADMKQVLAARTGQLRDLLHAAGLDDLAGTNLFQTATTRLASTLHERLAQARIWTRIFGDWPGHIRFGLPGSDADFARLRSVMLDGET